MKKQNGKRKCSRNRTKPTRASKPRKLFADEYRRIAKFIGRKFTERADEIIDIMEHNEGKVWAASLAIGKALANMQDALREDAGRVPNGCDIFRALAGRPRCRLEESALRNFARFARVYADLESSGKIPPKASKSHYVLVGGVGDPELQYDYLDTAFRDHLSVSELKRLIRGEPKKHVLYARDYIDLFLNGAMTASSEMLDAIKQEKTRLTEDDIRSIEELIRLLLEIVEATKKGVE